MLAPILGLSRLSMAQAPFASFAWCALSVPCEDVWGSGKDLAF